MLKSQMHDLALAPHHNVLLNLRIEQASQSGDQAACRSL
jgi:hypothetical protein